MKMKERKWWLAAIFVLSVFAGKLYDENKGMKKVINSVAEDMKNSNEVIEHLTKVLDELGKEIEELVK